MPSLLALLGAYLAADDVLLTAIAAGLVRDENDPRSAARLAALDALRAACREADARGRVTEVPS